jgi:peptidylprolyl isomerase
MYSCPVRNARTCFDLTSINHIFLIIFRRAMTIQQSILCFAVSIAVAGCQTPATRSIAELTSYPGERTSMEKQTTKSGLAYIDQVVGTGAEPKTGDKVTVHYTGYLTDGKKVDSSVDTNEPLTFVIGVGKVIKGWDEGIASMKVGGKRKLLIPSNLGYGMRGAGGVIPPNADLVFDVELIAIQ